jgi:rubrerythrin
LASYAGESQACLRYGFFAKKAKKEGFEHIASVLARTADEEHSHASRFYKLLMGGEVAIEAAYAAGGNGTTAENLRAAIAGEHAEWTHGYPEFARMATEDGFGQIARIFELIGKIEQSHEDRNQRLLGLVEAGSVFKREKPVTWRCRECGHLHLGAEAPDACPACTHPQAYFEVLGEVW